MAILATGGAGYIGSAGENTFALVGGAVQLKTKQSSEENTIRLSAKDPVFGVKTSEIKVIPSVPEEI